MITISHNMFKNNRNPLRASQSAELEHSPKRQVKHFGRRNRRCNICRQAFTPEFRFQLFCGKCRKQDDSYMFGEWLPRLPEPIAVALK